MFKINQMLIGVPREIKTHEYRVSLTPQGAAELTASGHGVLVEPSAGLGSGFGDDEYLRAGAEIAARETLFGTADLIVKVKEPLREEYGLLREGQTLFTFLHLAPNTGLLRALLERRITALGYETLVDRGGLPLLSPMSEIAGRMSPIVASHYLQKPLGGSGILPPGAAGVPPADIVIIGAGVVGENAARVASALGMKVAVLNRGVERLRHIDEVFQGRVVTMPATAGSIEDAVLTADIVVGAVLVRGEKAPTCVTRQMVSGMRKGSVVVDVSIDQGGCIETSRPTTHDEPVFEALGVLHYCVANMPGAYPRTSTLALTNSTLPYIKRLADAGTGKAIREDGPLRSAVNTHAGSIVHEGLAASTGLPLGAI